MVIARPDSLIFDLDGTLWNPGDTFVALSAGPRVPEGAFLFDGVADGLLTLKKSFRLFLVSNCDVTYLDRFLKWSKLENVFVDSECFGRTLLSKKENIELVIRRNRIESAIYVGDTAADQKAATSAGLPYFHMEYGFGTPFKPCVKFATFADLVESLTAPF